MLKKIAIGLAIVSTLGCGNSSNSFVVTAPNNPAPAVPAEVAAIFNKPVYQNSIWGLRVVDEATGQVLIDVEPERQFFIGSVRKVFSVGLLLETLGVTHTYDTPVFRQGDVDGAGVLDGDLVLVASGDLTMGGRSKPDGTLDITSYDHNEANSLGNAVLSSPDPLRGYKALAAQVADAGITRITGEVVIDDRLFEPFDFRDEFDVRPIFVNDDVVDLTINPTTVGDLASVEVRPLSAALTVVNLLQTTAAGTDLDLELNPEAPPIGAPGALAEVAGSLPIDLVPPLTNSLPLVRTFRISNPANYARTVFIEALEAEGVEVDAPTVAPNPVAALPATDSYDPADRVALLVGTPFGEVARFILKVSYNIGADTSLVLLGLTQGVSNITDALAVEHEILTTQVGLDGDDFRFIDGSGGGETTATTGTVTAMLANLLDFSTSATFLAALPVLAVDGSLGFVTDFTADPTLAGAAGNVRAKTGTFVAAGTTTPLLVKGQGLGGYIDTRGGRRLIYMLVVNEVAVSSIEELIAIFQDQGTISAILWREY